jgi:hypothetical protein
VAGKTVADKTDSAASSGRTANRLMNKRRLRPNPNPIEQNSNAPCRYNLCQIKVAAFLLRRAAARQNGRP